MAHLSHPSLTRHSDQQHHGRATEYRQEKPSNSHGPPPSTDQRDTVEAKSPREAKTTQRREAQQTQQRSASQEARASEQRVTAPLHDMLIVNRTDSCSRDHNAIAARQLNRSIKGEPST